MDRITVDMVKQAYEKTGLIPARGRYIYLRDGKSCGCGLGALIAAKFCSLGVARGWCYRLDDGITEVAVLLGHSRRYINSFALGFDSRILPFNDPEALAGFEDGTAAAREVFSELVPKS